MNDRYVRRRVLDGNRRDIEVKQQVSMMTVEVNVDKSTSYTSALSKMTLSVI